MVLRVWVVVKVSLSVLVLETAPPRGANASRMVGNAIPGAIIKEAVSMLISNFNASFILS